MVVNLPLVKRTKVETMLLMTRSLVVTSGLILLLRAVTGLVSGSERRVVS
jgi:hypothetical protein